MVKEIFEAHNLLLGFLTERNQRFVRDIGLSEHLDSTAFCFNTDSGRYVTLCAEGLPPKEQDFVLDHELGHIFIGHLTERRNCTSDEAEHMANIFGAVMLALSLYDEYKKTEAHTMTAGRDSSEKERGT